MSMVGVLKNNRTKKWNNRGKTEQLVRVFYAGKKENYRGKMPFLRDFF